MTRLLYVAACFALFVGFSQAEDLELDGLKSAIPDGWKMQEPSNRLRKYQFSLPKAKGDKNDGELVIFYFGKGGGGGEAANLGRWKGQFSAPQGKSIDDVAKLDRFKVGDVNVTYLDISGTYKFKARPFDTKFTPMENYRRIGVIFDSENGPYYITFTGPADTVAAHKKAFDGWLKGFK